MTGRRADSDGYHAVGRSPPPASSYPPTGHEADWKKLAQEDLRAAIHSRLPNIQTARNLILFIGDGMGVTSVTAGRWHKQKLTNITAHEATLSWDSFPTVGLAKVW